MTDQTQDAKTVDQLQDEIQKLKDKNTQLLNEKRAAQTQRDELADKLADTETRLGESSARLDYLTIQLPREEILEAASMPGAADMLWRELNHHFDVVRAEDGQDVLHQKDGQPLEIKGAPVCLTVEGLGSLFDSGTLKTIGRLLKGNGPRGGGAVGGRTAYASPTGTTKPAAPKESGFGLR